MNYIIKLKSKNDIIIKINNIVKNLKDGEELTFKLDIEKNESFSINVFFKDFENHENYVVDVLNNENKLEFLSPHIKIFQSQDFYYIELLNKPSLNKFKVLYNNAGILIYNYSTTNVFLNNTGLILDETFNLVEIINKNSLKLFEFKNEETKYLLVLNKENILFSDYYSSYKIENNKLTILSCLNDIAKHGKITSFNIQNGEKENEYFVYTKEKPILIQNDKLCVVAFLQAVKVKNFNLAKYYLSDNLKDKINEENLQDFFGNFNKTTYKFNENKTIASLFYKKDKNYYIGEKFEFIIKNKKIYKINKI